MNINLDEIKEQARKTILENVFGSNEEREQMRKYALNNGYRIIEQLADDIAKFYEYQTNSDVSYPDSAVTTTLDTSSFKLKNDNLDNANGVWVPQYKITTIPDEYKSGGKTRISPQLLDKNRYGTGNIIRLGGIRKQSDYMIAKYIREYDYRCLVLYNQDLFTLDPGITKAPNNPVYNKLSIDFKEVLDKFAEDVLYPILGGKNKCGCKIQINSLARTLEWCFALSGNKKNASGWSNHCGGIAADIHTFYNNKSYLNDFYNAAIEYGFGGVGKYPDENFIHVDIGPYQRWNGN